MTELNFLFDECYCDAAPPHGIEPSNQPQSVTMAQAGDDLSEWTTVTKNSKRCAGRKARRSSRSGATMAFQKSQSSTLALEDIETSLAACLEELRKSIFFQNVKASLARLASYESISEIVCYGIGNFGASRSCAPLWQLSLAIAIKDFLGTEQKKPVHQKKQSISLLFFDPCMSQQEAIFLERNSIHIIDENERGRRKASCSTLFFMPHCPMMLYANVLFTNWVNIRDVIIFGNSLSTYANRLGKANAGAKLLKMLEPRWEEYSLPIPKQDIEDRPAYFEQAFNDSSMTHFPMSQGNDTWPELPGDPSDDDDIGEVV